MILESFSQVLHQQWHPKSSPAHHVLTHWLLSYLLSGPEADTRLPDEPVDLIHRVLETELCVIEAKGRPPVIVARSQTGQILLKSLYQYCESYEQWMFRRWLHQASADEFNEFDDAQAS